MTLSSMSRVLIVEDEYFLADDLKKALNSEGAIVVGPVATEADALALLAKTPVDCAILDINLRGHMVYPLARTLRERNVPFLFVTGYDAPEPETGFNDVELIQKPFSMQDIVDRLGRITARHSLAAPPSQA